MAETVKVLRCNCQNVGQDKIYGHGMRVHNETQKKDYRCSVCSNQKKQ